MQTVQGKLVIAQGGGPTAVINQSLVGAIGAARHCPGITAVWGARHGVRGIVAEDFVDLWQVPSAALERVAQTPAAALGSTRDKPDAAYCARLVDTFRQHDVRYFFYIGGNDSADTVRIVGEFARRADYALRVVHIPKTIDNDLPVTDHCPGYPSAARFVIQALQGLDADNRALLGVYIAVIMGRHAGWLAAATALARRYVEDGPHLVYVPERAFVMEAFLRDVEAIHRQQQRCVIAVSEGIWARRDDHGKPIPLAVDLLQQSGRTPEVDAHGNVQLSGGALADALAATVQAQLGIKRVRADTFGYVQRAFSGVVSDVDAAEARALGEKAVHFATHTDQDGSVVLRRVGDYAVTYDFVPLTAVAAQTKTLPDAFINAEGNGVTADFHHYLRPLLGSGLPIGERLDAPKASF